MSNYQPSYGRTRPLPGPGVRPETQPRARHLLGQHSAARGSPPFVIQHSPPGAPFEIVSFRTPEPQFNVPHAPPLHARGMPGQRSLPPMNVPSMQGFPGTTIPPPHAVPNMIVQRPQGPSRNIHAAPDALVLLGKKMIEMEENKELVQEKETGRDQKQDATQLDNRQLLDIVHHATTLDALKQVVQSHWASLLANHAVALKTLYRCSKLLRQETYTISQVPEALGGHLRSKKSDAKKKASTGVVPPPVWAKRMSLALYEKWSNEGESKVPTVFLLELFRAVCYIGIKELDNLIRPLMEDIARRNLSEIVTEVCQSEVKKLAAPEGCRKVTADTAAEMAETEVLEAKTGVELAEEETAELAEKKTGGCIEEEKVESTEKGVVDGREEETVEPTSSAVTVTDAPGTSSQGTQQDEAGEMPASEANEQDVDETDTSEVVEESEATRREREERALGDLKKEIETETRRRTKMKYRIESSILVDSLAAHLYLLKLAQRPSNPQPSEQADSSQRRRGRNPIPESSREAEGLISTSYDARLCTLICDELCERRAAELGNCDKRSSRPAGRVEGGLLDLKPAEIATLLNCLVAFGHKAVKLLQLLGQIILAKQQQFRHCDWSTCVTSFSRFGVPLKMDCVARKRPWAGRDWERPPPPKKPVPMSQL